jgi:hypothetical protein
VVGLVPDGSQGFPCISCRCRPIQRPYHSAWLCALPVTIPALAYTARVSIRPIRPLRSHSATLSFGPRFVCTLSFLPPGLGIDSPNTPPRTVQENCSGKTLSLCVCIVQFYAIWLGCKSFI